MERFLQAPARAPYRARFDFLDLPPALAEVFLAEVRQRRSRGEPAADFVFPEILPGLAR